MEFGWVPFFKKGYNLGRTQTSNPAVGWMLPLMMVGFLLLMIIYPQIEGYPKNGVLNYSIKGPGNMHAPLFLSLFVGLAIGFLAQRSRFCTMGAFRDLLLFKQMHLFNGILSLVIMALITNLILGQFKIGFIDQPVAHHLHIWNFLGMALAGLAFALAGGCPGRQLFLSGEGDGDAAVFVMGMIVGAAFAHNFSLASSPKGLGAHGIAALIIGFVFCVFIGFTMSKKSV
ncbi:MAG: hypothetical protein OMM_03454 [Candidatus Magnetoglobus multicellularis str. Araruama]|uniref:Uncharacterized protein n=1 Tax=Candidatus Magnetoglobus multicellularis str. Araruama TaxID=890399 RepID=A0A1V1P5I1_9BACT|nr:MAG: hypothetical protein OMM_03454 [Candidatus Magnetoglobus multicellularis str. Araruama]